MPYGNTIVRTAWAMAAVAAAVSVTACQSGGGHAAADKPSTAAASTTAPATSGAVTVAPATARHTGTGTSPAAAVATPPVARTSPAAVATCAASALSARAYQAAHRPVGTGTGAAAVEFTNVSRKPCLVRGFPSVAGAGNGSPGHSKPLKVTPKGTASSVRLAPGAKAWVKLTFVQVQGEADGYCVSGSQPVVYPTLVVGLPGSGAHQVALADGEFAECDNKVTVTAVSATKVP
ncbi:DUF4232 domain-containing protein [Streptomyces sp. NPDC006739]|uniref:DUF4232 domain-containing protein n=1 Tax=Streptomyces sp. NPDC006739 TaxID=3364763 RepID=UPI0036844D45